jgi:hypothetical protein
MADGTLIALFRGIMYTFEVCIVLCNTSGNHPSNNLAKVGYK